MATKSSGASERARASPEPSQSANNTNNKATKNASIDFDAMTAKDLDRFLKAAEKSKANVSAYFGQISGVVERCPRYDSPDGLARLVYALRDSDGKSEGAQKLLGILAYRLRFSRLELNVIEICKCMAGLRQMASAVPGVSKVIEVMARIIASSPHTFESRSFGTIIYSLKYMNSDLPELRKLLDVLADKLEACNTPLDGQSIGNMLFGIRGMSAEYPEVRRLVAAIAYKVPEVPVVMKSQELGNAIYGLQRMSSEYRQVRDILSTLAVQLNRYMTHFDDVNEGDEEKDDTEEEEDIDMDLQDLFDESMMYRFSLSGQEISNALYGLQCMSDKHRDTRHMLDTILPAVRSPTTPLSSQAIGNALYGLQSMTSETTEVLNIIQALADQVVKCKEKLNAQTIGNALYGLKTMDSTSEEVRALLNVMAEKLRNSFRGPLNAQAIGNALYGLQNMSSEVKEVRLIIAALADRIEESNADLSGQAVGNGMYGLSGMSSASPEVRRLVQVMTAKVDTCSGVFSAQAVSNSLYGMQNMTSSAPEVSSFLTSLAKRMYDCAEPVNAQFIGNSLYGLKSFSTSDNVGAVRTIVGALAYYIYMSTRAYSLDGKRIHSNIEARHNLVGLSSVGSAHYVLNEISRGVARGVIPLSGQVVGMALYGLRGVSSEYVEVRALLAAILPSIQATSYKIDGQCIGNALYGLQLMSCRENEVKALVKYLGDKMMAPEVGIMSGQEVSMALYGCRGMELCPEVAVLMGCISHQLTECSDSLGPLALSECFNGLQNIVVCPELLTLFSILSDRIDRCLDPFDSHHIAMICMGFKRLDDTAGPVVADILNKLFNIVVTSELSLAPQHCANLLRGLTGVPASGRGLLGLVVGSCLEAVAKLDKAQSVAGVTGSVAIFEGHDPSEWRVLCQNLQLFMETDKSLPKETADKLYHLCDLLHTLLPSYNSGAGISQIERDVLDSLKGELGEELLKHIEVTMHEDLYCFESDIVLRFTRPPNGVSNPATMIINIEVDGYLHGAVNKMDFCQRRDQYLATRGVHVLRVKLAANDDGRLRDILETVKSIKQLLDL